MLCSEKIDAITANGHHTKDMKEDWEHLFIFSFEVASKFLCQLSLQSCSLRLGIKDAIMETKNSLAERIGLIMVLICEYG